MNSLGIEICLCLNTVSSRLSNELTELVASMEWRKDNVMMDNLTMLLQDESWAVGQLGGGTKAILSLFFEEMMEY